MVWKPVYQSVIDDGATAVQNGGVLHLTDRQCGDVVGRDVVDEIDGLRTPDHELSHVAHIEQRDALAYGLVLCGDTGRILHRHLKTGKWHHLGAERDVNVVQGRVLCQSFSPHIS